MMFEKKPKEEKPKEETKKDKRQERLSNEPVDWIRFHSYLNKVDKLSEKVDSLEKEMGLFNKLFKIADETGKSVEDVLADVEEQIVDPKAPYHELVSELLNDEFISSITPKENESFLFTISVPEKYSSLTTAEFKAMRGDKRSKVITNAQGKNGVRAFLELIKKNLGERLLIS